MEVLSRKECPKNETEKYPDMANFHLKKFILLSKFLVKTREFVKNPKFNQQSKIWSEIWNLNPEFGQKWMNFPTF